MFNRKYSGKYYVPAHRRRRPKYRRQQYLTIAIVAILCSIISCVSLAFLFTQTDPVENVFDNAYVACDVFENGPGGEGEFDGQTKTNVRIKNTGDTDAYIRVAVVVNWMDEAGTKVWATKPVEGADGDYTITYDLSNGWFDGGDGFYYYSKTISPEELTTILINEAKQLKSAPQTPDGIQYNLSIEIVASAIQSTPETVVAEQWGVTVNDGVITPKSN